MTGTEFLQRLSALAEAAGAEGDSARAVIGLIDGFGIGERASVSAASDDTAVVKAIRDQAEARLKELDQTLADGRDLFNLYLEMSPPDGESKPSLESWLAEKVSAGDSDKLKVDRLFNFLGAPGSENIREEILNTGDASKLESAITDAKSKIQSGLDQLDAVAEALAREEQPASLKSQLNFLDYLAEQEAEGNSDAGVIRQIVGQSTIEAEVIAGNVKLAAIMNVIDRGTAQSHSRQQRDLLKSAAKRLVDSYESWLSQGRLRGAFDATTRFLSNPQKWTISIVIALAGVVVLYGLMWPGVLVSFSNSEIARGFITLLFAVGALSIFMVITAAIVFDVNSNSREIYERAKTILSMLLGIFGTVLGFYFGLPDHKGADEEFAVGQIELIDADAGKLSFNTSVAGGTAPFQFFVHVADAQGKPLNNLARFEPSSDGRLILSSPIDVSKQAGGVVKVVVNATDSEGRAAQPSHLFYAESKRASQ